MSLSLYDASVGSYLQTVKAVSGLLAQAEQSASEGILNLEEALNFRLREDMLPLSFQIISVWHHSMGALEGMKAGLFEPPPSIQDITWEKLTELLAEAHAYLASQDREAIDALGGRDMLFRAGKLQIPFTTDSFLLSFSPPNVYFHATTTYAILRQLGVPLGKLDYLGDMRTTL